MNGFQKHNLDHTSASQINMWEESPAAWVARYLFGKKFKFGVAAQIGVLTEKVVENVLFGMSHGEALQLAYKEFDRSNALNTNEKELARKSDIEHMSTMALEVLAPYGEPEMMQDINGRSQQRIELKCNGPDWELPIVGYLDFVYPQHGLIIDLKTTLRCPSTMSRAHQRQASIYSKAKGNMGVKFLYVTPKKSALLEVDDENDVLKEVKNILTRQERILRAFTADELRKCVPLGLSSFFWNGSEEILNELYGD